MRDESQRDERVMTLVAEVMGRPPETRESFLRSACDDPELIAEVEERVRWEQRMEGFLSQNVVQVFELLDRPFEPGDLVAGRFRILAELGRGGMGVVYDVLDEKLERRIAIKAALRGHDSRLPPEARAAREVSHFNVCKVHELHTAQTEEGAVEFLTMELVEGETLSARIRRAGPLPPLEARNIALQICAGLAQAHRQGVVHGDLKCGNVILADSPAGTRAVITDFGLAATYSSGEDESKTPFRAGSFDYMAPEIFAGSPVSAASDIYALGVLFHVMLTGRTPATDEDRPTHENTTVTLPSGAYRPHRRDRLAQPWNAIVDRCLQAVPGERFHSAEEVIAKLEAPPKQRKWLWAIPAAAAVLAVAGWYSWPQTSDSVRLAVLPVTVDGAAIPAAAGLGVEVADRFSNARRGFVVIPPDEARRNRVSTPDEARTVLAATHVLRTKVRNNGGLVTIEASVFEIGSGRAVQQLRGDYAPKDEALMAKALTATITRAFHLRSGIPLEVLAASAYPSYVQGLYLLRRDGVSADQAIPFFQQAIELDPKSALPYAAIAEAQLQKFRRGGGAEWLARATESSAKSRSLNPDSAMVLVASGRVMLQHGRYDQAAQEFSRATELAPGNSDAWNHLATSYAGMNRFGEAAATYQRAMRAEPDYYAPYISCGLFYFNQGRFDEAEHLFRKVTALAPGLADGHQDLGLALEQQGRFPEAEQSLLKALHLQESSFALSNLGVLYYQQMRYDEAAHYFEMSVQLGPNSAVVNADLGDAYRHLGRTTDSDHAYNLARALYRADVAQNPKEPFARAGLARVSALLSDRTDAEFEIEQALEIGVGDERVLRLAAMVYESIGRRDKAIRTLSSAPHQLLAELSRQPDMTDLAADPQFQEILQRK